VKFCRCDRPKFDAPGLYAEIESLPSLLCKTCGLPLKCLYCDHPAVDVMVYYPHCNSLDHWERAMDALGEYDNAEE
jgi:hypothetical protein